MTRDEAAAAGEVFYNTGIPCKNGHIAERYVSSGACIECRRKTGEAWRNNNPDKVKQHAHKHNQTQHRKDYMRVYMRNYRAQQRQLQGEQE